MPNKKPVEKNEVNKKPPPPKGYESFKATRKKKIVCYRCNDRCISFMFFDDDTDMWWRCVAHKDGHKDFFKISKF